MITLLRDFILALNRQRYLKQKVYAIPYSEKKIIIINGNGFAETEEIKAEASGGRGFEKEMKTD